MRTPLCVVPSKNSEIEISEFFGAATLFSNVHNALFMGYNLCNLSVYIVIDVETDMVFRQPLKTLFVAWGGRWWPIKSYEKDRILCVLWLFHSAFMGRQIRPKAKRGVFRGAL